MRLKSIRSRLLAYVCALVIGSGLLISFLVTHRYTDNLLAAVAAQAESLAHATALESTDKILINDLVALQKMLDHQMKSNPSLAYLFILRDGRVEAHTFAKGVPADLIDANAASKENEGNVRRVVSTDGERYLDVAWPIFAGRTGVLRLGFSERTVRDQMTKLWLQMSLFTLGVLVMAVAGTLVFVRRFTRPISELASAVRRLDEGDLDVSVDVRGQDETAVLAASFNQMVTRVKDYTTRLEAKARELERSHQQTRTFCEIVREIGALPSLQDVGSSLITRFREILSCNEMALIILNEDRSSVYVLRPGNINVIRDVKTARTVVWSLEQAAGRMFSTKPIFRSPLVPDPYERAARQAIIPLASESGVMGCLVIACPGHCLCDIKDSDVVRLILEQTVGVIQRAVLQEERMNEIRGRVEKSSDFAGIIGRDPKMQIVYRLIEDTARTDAGVLIQGESGTGKELAARAVHNLSDRKDKAFVVINCSAYPDTLLESELFGYEKGAFTGAIRTKPGRFEQADGGTVFLDEIGEIPPQAQVKLLRVLQTQAFERLGGENTIKVNVRVLAATNKDLMKEVRKGTFRDDLFYRLNIIPIHMPPLRERRNDIPLLAAHFLKRFVREQGKGIQQFSPEAMRLIMDCPWPGNIRELENSIEHAVVLAQGTRIEAADLPPAVRTAFSQSSAILPLIEDAERTLVEKVLADCGWNKKKAARELGIGRSTLYAKIRRFGLSKPTLQ